MLRTLVLFAAIVAIEVSGLRVVDRLEDLEGADGMFRNEPDQKPTKTSFLQLNLQGKTSIDALAQSLPTSPEEVTELLQTEAPDEVLNGLKYVHNFLGGMIVGDAYEKQDAVNTDCSVCRSDANTAMKCGGQNPGVQRQTVCNEKANYDTVKTSWDTEQGTSSCVATKSICRHFTLQESTGQLSISDFDYLAEHTGSSSHNSNVRSIVDYAATIEQADITAGSQRTLGRKKFLYKAVSTQSFIADSALDTELEGWRDNCFDDSDGYIAFHDQLTDLYNECILLKNCIETRTTANVCGTLNTCWGDGVASGPGQYDTKVSAHNTICHRIQMVDEMVLRVKCMVSDTTNGAGTQTGTGVSQDACAAAGYTWASANRTEAQTNNVAGVHTHTDGNEYTSGVHFTNLTCGTLQRCAGSVSCVPGSASLTCPDIGDVTIASTVAAGSVPDFSGVTTECASSTAVPSIGALPSGWDCSYSATYPDGWTGLEATSAVTTSISGNCPTFTNMPAHPYRPYVADGASGGDDMSGNVDATR